MPVNPTDQPLTFHCTSCNGRIQTPASFAGFSAPCPFCAQFVTALYPKPAQWVPAPATQRATIKRLTLPDHLSEPPLEAVQIAPRDIRPHPNHATSASPTTEPAVSKLDQLFNTIVAMEERIESRPRLRRKGKIPFERPLRRTDDRDLQAFRSR